MRNETVIDQHNEADSPRHDEKFHLEYLFPPDESGVLMAVRSYFDASVRGDCDIITLAGVAFGYESSKRASKQWEELFAGKKCHMKQMMSGNGSFKGLGEEAIAEYVDGAIEIINNNAVACVAASFCRSDIADILPTEAPRKHGRKLLEGFKNPYSIAAHLAMLSVADKTKGDIHCVFELGDDGQQSARKYLEWVKGEPHSPLREQYRMGSLIFDGKCGNHPLLCAADILAWEWGRGMQDIESGKPISKRLRSLLKGFPVSKLPSRGRLVNEEGLFCCHYSGDSFIADTRKLAQLLGSRTLEEVEEIRGVSG